MMGEFRLPIEYAARTYEIAESMVEDLEVVESRGDGSSMYDVLLSPKTSMARRTAQRAARRFTDDTSYLKATVQMARKVDWEVYAAAEAFGAAWSDQGKTSDFNALYHFVEHPRLERLNHYPWVLLILSVQSILSPMLFLMSPILILLLPFAILQITSRGVSWATYRAVLGEVLQRHALGSLFYGPKTLSNAVSSGAALGLFFVQLYSSLQSCWQFHRNLLRVHTFLEDAQAYLNYATDMMRRVEAAAPDASYEAFAADVGAHRAELERVVAALDKVAPFRYGFGEVRQLGYLRYLFYQLKHNAVWRRSVDYALDFTGYVETMASVRRLLKAKRVAACRFLKPGKGFKVRGIHYPLHAHHERHAYALTDKVGTLVTGPNASGKTTFVKTAMLGVLFSQQYGCGFYEKASLAPFAELCCYLNIPDTSGRDSLFQAEARRCREILELAQGGRQMFCIFDELFSGTNPYEASASAYGVLTHLAKLANVRFLLTTHFLDLCTRLGDNKKLENVHMKTTVTPEGGLKYDYKLVEGISSVKGGLQVLHDLGFPKAVVDCAKTY